MGDPDDIFEIKPENAERLRRAAAAVETLTPQLGLIRGIPAPAAGSLCECDGAVPLARFTRPQATIAVSVAVDHLRAWSGFIETGRIPNYAPLSLVRVAIETSAFARWLVDPALTAMERVARGVAAQLDDHDQRRKFEEALGAPPPPPGPAQNGAQRFAELRAQRDSDGVPVIRFPGPTAIVAAYPEPPGANGAWPYRLASAFSHGKVWSLVGMNLGHVRAARESGVSIPVVPDENILTNMTDVAVRATARGLQDVSAYLGLPLRRPN